MQEHLWAIWTDPMDCMQAAGIVCPPQQCHQSQFTKLQTDMCSIKWHTYIFTNRQKQINTVSSAKFGKNLVRGHLTKLFIQYTVTGTSDPSTWRLFWFVQLPLIIMSLTLSFCSKLYISAFTADYVRSCKDLTRETIRTAGAGLMRNNCVKAMKALSYWWLSMTAQDAAPSRTQYL